MGILNVTPDSFSDGGLHACVQDAMAHALTMTAQGAGIIDVGGESTRPGAEEVSIQEELDRVLPVVSALAPKGICVSIDTRHAQVAQACLDAGASIVNDVSGFRDPSMRQVVAAGSCGCVVMHMLGEPGTMQQDPCYEDVVAQVGEYLTRQASLLQGLGVSHERICIDPGPGFGKTATHNQELLAAMPALCAYGYPVMCAVSRKSFIGAVTGLEDPVSRDLPSALCAAAAHADGASVVRTHNVAATADALKGSRRCLIGLGSNIGDGPAQLDQALGSLGRMPGIWVTRVSDYIQSEPAYVEDQPVFTNAVALLQTTLEPYALLDALHQVENAQGRVRTLANGPRTLDLDVLDYEGVISADPVLTLPHPLILERDFVVTPLLQICPGHVLADGTPVTRDAIACGAVIGA